MTRELSRCAGLVALIAAVLATAAAAPATAAPTITFDADGLSSPVFDLDQAVRERIFIPQRGIDQDRDGQDDKIAIEIIRPKESGAAMKVPAIIDPSPYYTTVCRGNEGECIADVDGDGLNDKWPLFYENYFLPRGYAVILAESNGTANSNGCPLHGGPGDIAGMKSVIDWLNGRARGEDKNGNAVSADWHSRKAAMIGKSYDGTLTNGVAATGVSGLTTIIPISAISDWYAYSRMGGVRLNTNYPSTLSNLITNLDRRTLCAPTRTTMNAEDGDETGDRNVFWDARNYLPNAANVSASVFVTHGLQDDNVATEHFADWWSALAANGVPRKLWLLREGHVDPFDSRRAEWVDQLHRWLDHFLLGAKNGITSEPRVDIEDDKDTWRTYADWPIPGTQDTNVFLRGTTATTAGSLGLSSGGDVDSVAWTNAPTQLESSAISNPTAAQTSRRVFLSPPLTKDVRISGTPVVDLRAKLSQSQSNLGAMIVDYGPGTQITRSADGVADATTSTCWGQSSTRTNASGQVIDHGACYLEVTKPTVNVTAWRIARGILDSSNRNSLTTPTLVTPDVLTQFRWRLRPTDYTFKAGHQIAVVVVGDYREIGVAGTPGATITMDAKLSKVTLPIVGGYSAFAASGASTSDTVGPAQTVPNDIVVDAEDRSGAIVTYPAPGVSDNEDPAPTASCAPASGSRFPVGATTVTCTAHDATGNTTTGTFKVTVNGQLGWETPPQGDIPAPPAPEGGGSTPIPPAPDGSTAPQDSSTQPPTLDVVDRLAPALRGIRLGAGRHAVRVSFRLSETATVTASIRRHGSQKALKKAKARLGKGSRAITLRSSKLGPGLYTVKLTARDASGNARNVSRAVRLRR